MKKSKLLSLILAVYILLDFDKFSVSIRRTAKGNLVLNKRLLLLIPVFSQSILARVTQGSE